MRFLSYANVLVREKLSENIKLMRAYYLNLKKKGR